MPRILYKETSTIELFSMDGLTALQVFTALLLVHATNGQTLTVSGPSRATTETNISLICTLSNGPRIGYPLEWFDASKYPSETIYYGSSRGSADDKYLNFYLTSLSSIESVMTIENAEGEDDGLFGCTTLDFPLSNTLDLVIEAASTLTVTLTSLVTNNEDMYEATCDAVGGKPQEYTTWYLKGVPQTDGNGSTIVETNPPATAPLSNTKSVFTFPATIENYRQILVCQVSGHQISELNRQKSEVLDHISPCDAGTTVIVDYVTQGTGITVSCSARNPPRPPMRNYYIFSNGIRIHESMDGGNAVNVSDPEAGTQYTCMAGSYLGNTTLNSAVTYYDPQEPIPYTPEPTGLSSAASAGIAVLAILLVVSVISNIIQFIMSRKKETQPGFEASERPVSREERHVSNEANDNMAYEMIGDGDRAFSPFNFFIIAPENVTFLTKLGSSGRGDFGEVWKGELRSNQSQVDVVIRVVPDQVIKTTNVLQAVKVLSELPDQPNVVTCLGYCQEQGSILYEFISGGTLLTHLQTTGVQSQPTYSNLENEGSLMNLAWQIAMGMQFLASKKIFHGTLCARNVLLTNRKQCKLSDYGLSSSLFSGRSEPTRWSSPETMVTGDQSTEGDIWSFGIVLWEIVKLGARPYPTMTFDTVQTEVANGYQMPCPRHCGQEVYAVMCGCWEKEPTDRSNFDQILKSLKRILEQTQNHVYLTRTHEDLYENTQVV